MRLFLRNINGDGKPNFQDAMRFWKAHPCCLTTNSPSSSSPPPPRAWTSLQVHSWNQQWPQSQGFPRHRLDKKLRHVKKYIKMHFFLRKINYLSGCISPNVSHDQFSRLIQITFLIPRYKSLWRGYCNHWNMQGCSHHSACTPRKVIKPPPRLVS